MPLSWRAKKINLSSPATSSMRRASATCDPALVVDGGRLVCSSWTRADRPGVEAPRLEAGPLIENFAPPGSAGWVEIQPSAIKHCPARRNLYTFAIMSYTLDIYLRRAQPARNFLDYALFVTFFPHLVAGPIMRPNSFCNSRSRVRRQRISCVSVWR
jgi:hypothetical protein